MSFTCFEIFDLYIITIPNTDKTEVLTTESNIFPINSTPNIEIKCFDIYVCNNQSIANKESIIITV